VGRCRAGHRLYWPATAVMADAAEPCQGPPARPEVTDENDSAAE
jgi:hypothetical protein